MYTGSDANNKNIAHHGDNIHTNLGRLDDKENKIQTGIIYSETNIEPLVIIKDEKQLLSPPDTAQYVANSKLNADSLGLCPLNEEDVIKKD